MSKTNQCRGLFGLYKAQRDGVSFKPGAKDGSIPTHPVVWCPDIPELGKDGVTDLCYKWLTVRRILVDRMNVGVGSIRRDDEKEHKYTFGIPGAGDLLGILPTGIHFEVECKQGKGGRLSEKQQERQRKVLTPGGMYVIVHGIPEMEYYFKGII